MALLSEIRRRLCVRRYEERTVHSFFTYVLLFIIFFTKPFISLTLVPQPMIDDFLDACWIRRRVRPCLTGLCHLNRLGCTGRSRTQSGGSCSRWPPTSRTGSGRGRDPSYDSREGMDANRDMQAEGRYHTPRRTRRWLIEARRYL